MIKRILKHLPRELGFALVKGAALIITLPMFDTFESKVTFMLITIIILIKD